MSDTTSVPPFAASRWTLAGQRALVTGGSKGIGAAIAGELLGLGAQVTIVARGDDLLRQRIAGWEESGGTAFGVVADVTTEAGRQTAVEFATERMGGLDILVNNVGTNVRKTTVEIGSDEYAHILNTNLTAAWEMARAAYPALKASGSASVVNIGSVAGSLYVGTGSPYALSKAALDELTRYLACEWAADNIRVNSVNPWYTRTPLAAPVLDDPERLGRVLARTPLGRVAGSEDVAGISAFLCLPAAGYITGQCIAVDGGFLNFGFRPNG